MAAIHVDDDSAFLAPLPEIRLGKDHDTPEELFRWACFLDQGQPRSVSREQSVDALLAAADGDRDLIVRARHYALRALGLGIGTRGVVELFQEALDHAE